MNQKGFANIILVAVIVILVGAVGYFALIKKPGEQTPTQSTKSTNPSWKDNVYNQFINLTSWKVDENLSDWRLTDLDRSNFNRFPKGKIFQMAKSFNETGFPGPDVDQQINQAGSEQKALEDAVKKTLNDNGWKFSAGPTEGGFYHDYLYVKDDHPLILQIGTRDAVTGGMFVAIEFQY